MNTDNNISREAEGIAVKKRPSVAVTVVFALVSAVMALLISQLGLLPLTVFAAIVTYVTSAASPVIVTLIPLIGIGVTYVTDGIAVVGVALAVFAASYAAGMVIRRGGDFHRAFMAFLFTGITITVAAVAAYTRYYDISAKEIADLYYDYMKDAMETAVASASAKLPMDTAVLLSTQYEEVLRATLLGVPAITSWIIEFFGLIVIRLAGYLHTVTGCTTYPMYRRPATVSRTFAVVYFVSVFLMLTSDGLFGACATNVMLVLMVPAMAAGISSYRRAIVERRMRGMRGFPGSVVLLIFVTLAMSLLAGFIFLSLTGAFSAFGKGVHAKYGPRNK